MPAPGIPSNFNLQTANRNNYLSWTLTAGATSYSVLRSTDGIAYALLATPTYTDYLDTAVVVGTKYWYKVAGASTVPALATGTITFTTQPVASETFSVANVTFTAVASGATGNQFNIGGTLALTLDNIVAATNSSPNLARITTSEATSSTVVTFTAYEPGVEGNGLELSTQITGSAASGFSGGVIGVLSAYTVPQDCVPVPVGEMSLGQLRLVSQQRADRVNSNFVTLTEWNQMINQSLFELYDLLVTAYGEEYFVAVPAQFNTTGSTQLYPLPNGVLSFTDPSGNAFIAPPLYKLMGVDLGLNPGINANGWVTLKKFNFTERNKYFYPNTAATLYGVYNAQYRILGNQIEFIPIPSANEPMRLWYIPMMTMLLKDTDITNSSVSGWIEYVIVDAAIKALQKEESDTSVLMAQKMALMKRIEGAAMNRDAGMPDTISDTRNAGFGNGSGPIGSSGGYGGAW